MKTFILRKSGVVTRKDSDYKSFGMEPQNLFSPPTKIEVKLQFARGEIQMKVHKALLGAGAGRHGVGCSSLKLSGKSLSFRLFVSSIKERDFKEDKMKKVDVKSAVSSSLKEFFGSRAVGSVSVSVEISKETHDPRIAPTYRIVWNVAAALEVRRKDSAFVRKDMAMSNSALSKLSSLKGCGKTLAGEHNALENCQRDILAYMRVLKTEIGKWGALKSSLTAGSSKEEDFDISSIEARLADFNSLFSQLKLAEGRIKTALKTSKDLPHKCNEFTNTAAKFT